VHIYWLHKIKRLNDYSQLRKINIKWLNGYSQLTTLIVLILFIVMLATLIGSRWRDYESRIHSEIEHLALMLHNIFKHSVPLSVFSPKVAMSFRLPIWTRYVKTVDMVMEKVHNLVPKILQFDNDGLLKIMVNDIDKDIVIRIIADFIIAAGDTVRLLIYQYI